jgi:hypothetical protein
MRSFRILALLVTAALAAMALTASAVSAQVGPDLEITDEENNNVPCPPVTIVGTDVEDGCLIHANSESGNLVELRKHVFGIESHITKCNNEFFGRVDSHAEGYIYEPVLSGPDCTREPCKVNGSETGESIPWQAHGKEGGGSETREILTVNFCLEGIMQGGAEEHCEIEIPFEQEAGSGLHDYEFGHNGEIASHGVSGFRCEIIGHWHTEWINGQGHDGDQETEVKVRHWTEPS